MAGTSQNYVRICWWFFRPTPLKNEVNVSWDDYSQYMEKKLFQTTNQEYLYIYIYNVGPPSYKLSYNMG